MGEKKKKRISSGNTTFIHNFFTAIFDKQSVFLKSYKQFTIQLVGHGRLMKRTNRTKRMKKTAQRALNLHTLRPCSLGYFEGCPRHILTFAPITCLFPGQVSLTLVTEVSNFSYIKCKPRAPDYVHLPADGCISACMCLYIDHFHLSFSNFYIKTW